MKAIGFRTKFEHVQKLYKQWKRTRWKENFKRAHNALKGIPFLAWMCLKGIDEYIEMVSLNRKFYSYDESIENMDICNVDTLKNTITLIKIDLRLPVRNFHD